MMENIYQAAAIFSHGGFVMYPLLLCSIAVVAIFIDRLACFRAAATDMAALAAAIDALPAFGWEEGAGACEKAGGLAAVIVAKAVRMGDEDGMARENYLEGEAARAVAQLRHRLGYLETIITAAPLLGLLGTVIGMIRTFNVLAIRSGQPQAITGGVGEALVATAAGLIVALMALAVHSYFAQRLDRLISDLEQAFSRLADAPAGGERR